MIITAPRKTRRTSILAEDLSGLISFDSKNTLPVTDMSSPVYNDGMARYLQGVANIDAEYNEAVKVFETQLQESELAAKMQANLMSEQQANMAVEAQPGLGTGMASIASSGRQAALGAVHAGIEESIAETYQTGIQQFTEGYQAKLEAVLGEYDPVTGTFAGLSAYENTANSVTEATMQILAMTLDPNSGEDYIDILIRAGYIDNVAGAEITLNATGRDALDALINSVDADQKQAVFGNKTLIYAIAEQMAKNQYASEYLTEDGENRWDLLSESKQAELITEYESWIYNNMDSLRLTHWDLYSVVDGQVVLDKEYSLPDIPDTLLHDGVVEDSGIPINMLAYSQVSDCSEEEFAEFRKRLIDGEIPEGAYFTFQAGKAYDDDKFYYFANGAVYTTGYTIGNPPPVIPVNSASVYSFGLYYQTGTGKGHQDERVQLIIDAAKANRIGDGMYVNFNEGTTKSGGKAGWYQYIDGTFVKVSSSTEITMYTGSGKKRTVKLKDSHTTGWSTTEIYYPR